MTLVFFGHFERLFWGYLPDGGFSQRLIGFLAVIGHQGVCFFLVLSGYFVYQSYFSNPTSFSSFALRRVRRIYPPYVAMLSLYAVLSLFIHSESKIPSGWQAILYLASNLLMISSRPMITVSWTIGTLLALYTLVPFFWKTVRYERWRPGYRIAFIMASVWIWYSVPKPIPMLDPRVAFVFVGFVLYEAVKAGAEFESSGELRGLAILGIGYVLWYAADLGWLGFTHLPLSWNHYTFLAPGLFYACGYAIRSRGRLASFLESVGLPRLGRMSYSYYLCHGAVIKALQLLLVAFRPEATPSLLVFWVGLPFAYVCTLAAAWAWFRLVEVRLATFTNPFARTGVAVREASSGATQSALLPHSVGEA